MTRDERDLLDRAFRFAAEAHAGKTRKGSNIPYVSHLLQVAGLVLEHGGSVEQAAAGLLHDTVEDCETVSIESVRQEFGAPIAHIVETCTDTAPGEHPDQKGPWRQRKERYLQQLRAADAESALVAACDKRHNLGTLVTDVRNEGRAYLKRFNAAADEQLWYYEQLFEVLRTRVPPKLSTDLERLIQDFRDLVGGER